MTFFDWLRYSLALVLVVVIACSRLSVSGVDRKAGAERAGSGEKNKRARACSRLSVSGVDRKAGAGRAGSGEKNKRAREGEPVSIVFKTSFRPLLKR